MALPAKTRGSLPIAALPDRQMLVQMYFISR